MDGYASLFGVRRLYGRLGRIAISDGATGEGHAGLRGALARSVIDMPSTMTASGINSMIAPSARALNVALGYIVTLYFLFVDFR